MKVLFLKNIIYGAHFEQILYVYIHVINVFVVQMKNQLLLEYLYFCTTLKLLF